MSKKQYTPIKSITPEEMAQAIVKAAYCKAKGIPLLGYFVLIDDSGKPVKVNQ